MSNLNKLAAEAMFPDKLECGCECGKHKWNFALNEQMPNDWYPTTNRNHTAMLEDEIARRGLRREYLVNLFEIANEDTKHHNLMAIVLIEKADTLIYSLWNMHNATGTQRTRAFLATVGGDE